MKGDKALHYLASRIGQLELEKAVLLTQLEELNESVDQLKKEVEINGTSTKTDDNESK